MKWRLAISLALVGVLYVFHVHLKTTKIFSNPTWDAREEVGQFWSEFAFHYRFAKFFAEHPLRDWSQLAHDRAVQFPDTINDWAEFTVAMEVPVGVLYRWIYGSPLTLTLSPEGRGEQASVPFHVWGVWYDCLVSSLTMVAVFFLARALWRSDGAGLFASVLYATLYPSYGRTVKNLFLREDFAIPLIVFALFFTMWALREDRRQFGNPGVQVAGGLFWLAALASWHLTQFLLAVVVVAVVLVYLGKGETPRRPWIILVLTIGSVLIPVLRAKQFYLSPAMCLLYALTLAVWINGGRKRATGIFLTWAALLLLAGATLQKSYGEYAHVYQLFLYKLRFLGVKPADPAALSWEARTLWEGAFNTASLGEFWRSLQWCLPLMVVTMIWRDRQRDECAARIFLVFTLMLVPLSWMVVRYFTFLGFAAAVVAAGVFVKRQVWWKLAVVAAAGWQLATLNFQPLEKIPADPQSYRPVVAWIKEHTPTNAVLLAHIAESPVFWAHTGRPIILHSKFENRKIRERYRELLETIYGSEEQFFEFAKKYQADYFIFDDGFLLAAKDSRRYKADKLGELPADCAALAFHERPEQLRHFKFEMAAGRFTVFRVVR